jgi:glycosyltransferase involved in cell wall biosynthesis
MTEFTRPLVSLGLPVYNGEDFVAAALESVAVQTLSDYQLIICDNASTDATEDICRRYAAGDTRIQYIRNPVNLGAGPNFNLTFKYATGRYFK